MNCDQCGGQNADDATNCVLCGASLGGANPYQSPIVVPGLPRPKVPNYLVYAIVTTLCCCVPFGIVAIFYAAQVDRKFAAGDYQGARLSSRNAKMWCRIGVGVGLLVNVIVGSLRIAAFMAQNDIIR
jgi:hypothetical protein